MMLSSETLKISFEYLFFKYTCMNDAKFVLNSGSIFSFANCAVDICYRENPS